MARDTDDIVREVRIAARPEEVFPFFTDPRKMVTWKAVDADLDPRPGGLFRINVTGEDIARGEYVEIDPPRRVVFTWGWETPGTTAPPGSSVVEITLRPDGDGTILRLVHRGVPDEMRGGSQEGWDHYLARLVLAAQGTDPGPDPWAKATAALGGDKGDKDKKEER